MKIIKIIGILLIAISALFAAQKTISDTDLGLRKVPLNNNNVKLKDFSYSTQQPGESKLIERSYENAPPMIPHSVEGMMDITKDYNACLGCHSPDVASIMKATPIPPSHMYDTFKGKSTGKLVENRFNCNLCHIPQANVSPVVKNDFKPDFRNALSKKKSNLLDVLDEGVK